MMKSRIQVLGPAFLALACLLPLRAQQEGRFEERLEEMKAAALANCGIVVAGRVLDRDTGMPLEGATIGPDRWYEGEYDRPGLLWAFRLHSKDSNHSCSSDDRGRFVMDTKRLDLESLSLRSPIRIMARARGYLPTVVTALSRSHSSYVGYSMKVEMERCLGLKLAVTDANENRLRSCEVSWLLLKDDLPVQMGQTLIDEDGYLQLNLEFFRSAEGLALHLWNENESLRFPLSDLGVVDGHDLSGSCVLRPTPATVKVAWETQAESLQTMDLRLSQFGCVHYPHYGRSFEYALVSLGEAPGAPQFLKFDGSPQTMEAALVPGRAIAIARLDRKSDFYRRFDGGRQRLDRGPAFHRETFDVAEDGKTRSLFDSGLVYEKVKDDLPVLGHVHRRLADLDLPDLPGLSKRDELKTLKLEVPELVDLRYGRIHFVEGGLISEDFYHLKMGVAQLPVKWVERSKQVLLSPYFLPGPGRQQEVPEFFKKGPVLMNLVPGDDPQALRLQPVEIVKELTLRVQEKEARPVRDAVLVFHSESAKRLRWSATASGLTPWGLAIDPAMKLPYAMLRTDSDGEVRLGSVPLGTWTLEVLLDGKSYGLRQLKVEADTTQVVIHLES